MENAFVAIVPTRPCPLFGRPVHRRDGSHRFRPGASPQALRIPPRGGHPALPDSHRGQRGVTPAFGYGALHPSTNGTSTHLSTSLPSAHYDPLRRLARQRASTAVLCALLAVPPPRARPPVFNAFLLRRAVPATPEERLGASAEHLPEACGLRLITRGSASSLIVTRLHLGSLRATARRIAAAGLHPSGILVPLLLDASRHHAGDHATLLLSDS